VGHDSFGAGRRWRIAPPGHAERQPLSTGVLEISAKGDILLFRALIHFAARRAADPGSVASAALLPAAACPCGKCTDDSSKFKVQGLNGGSFVLCHWSFVTGHLSFVPLPLEGRGEGKARPLLSKDKGTEWPRRARRF